MKSKMARYRILKMLTLFATSSCVGLTLNVMEVEADFSRRCINAVHCVFEPKGPSRVYLDCKNGYCSCQNYAQIANVPVWGLLENENKCWIDDGGPCGRDNGLDILCTNGFECIDSQCRIRSKIGTHQLGQECLGDIDCEQGLVCFRRKSLQHTKFCVTPRSVEEASSFNNKEILSTTTTTTTTPSTISTVQPKTVITRKNEQLHQRDKNNVDGMNSTNSNGSGLLDEGDDDSPKIPSSQPSHLNNVPTFPILFILFFQTVIVNFVFSR